MGEANGRELIENVRDVSKGDRCLTQIRVGPQEGGLMQAKTRQWVNTRGTQAMDVNPVCQNEEYVVTGECAVKHVKLKHRGLSLAWALLRL